jgi:glycosidase
MKHHLRTLALCFLLILLLAACRPAAPAPAPATAPAAPPTAALTPASPLPQGTDGMPWWNDAVFYEVFVRSFADSTSGPLANDGIGDLQGLIEKLDYLNDGNPATRDDLGITGIWLMPIMQSSSYHGYDVTDYYTVEQDYGTNEDFKRLMAEAHERGIRVIIDLVLNHTAKKHPWFQDAAQPDAAHRDWYIWAAEDLKYRGPWGERVWYPLGGQWYYAIFAEGMPDLNYRNPAVTEEMLKVTRYWLTEMGADGYRLDAIRHLIEDGQVQENTPATHAWLRTFHKVYKEANPNAVAVGEVWTDTRTVASYIGDQLDLAFEFDLAQAILNSVNNRARTDLAIAQDVDLKSFPPGQYATFLTNHDQNRTLSQLALKVDRARLAATVLLTGPGVPFIYYGEEIGMRGMKPDEKIRTPMQWTPGANAGFSAHKPWQPVTQGYEQVNVQSEGADPDSLLNLYRKLIALRNAHPALRVGDTLPVEVENRKVYAILRQSAGEKVLVVYNFDEQPVRDYALSLASSEVRGFAKLSGALKATELLNDAQAIPPALNAQGGFAGYKPITELAPRTGYVILLAP